MNREVLKENQNQGWFSSATKKVTSDLIPWDRPLWTWPQNVSVPIWKPFKVQMKMEQKSIRIRKYSKRVFEFENIQKKIETKEKTKTEVNE